MDNTELRQINLNTIYLVSKSGYVWRLMKGRPRYQNNTKNNTHYFEYENSWYRCIKPYVMGKNRNYLAIDINNKNYSIHRLVLSTFCNIENSELYQVNHIDRNTFNNNLSNLEWVNCKDNIAHKFKTELPDTYDNLRKDWYSSWESFCLTSDIYQIKSVGGQAIYDTNEISRLLTTTTLTKQEIADKLGCSFRSVRHWAEKLTSSGVKRPKKKTLDILVNQLLQENPNYTPKELAIKLNKRVTSIHTVLRSCKV